MTSRALVKTHGPYVYHSRNTAAVQPAGLAARAALPLDTSNRPCEMITSRCLRLPLSPPSKLSSTCRTLRLAASTSRRRTSRMKPLDSPPRRPGERRLANHDHLTRYRRVGLRLLLARRRYTFFFFFLTSSGTQSTAP